MQRNKLTPAEIEKLASKIEIPNTKVVRQTTALTNDIIHKIFGTGLVSGSTYEVSSPEAYLMRSQAIQQSYLNAVMEGLTDPKQAPFIGGGRFAGLTESSLKEQLRLLAQQENLDLSLLTTSAQKEILGRHRDDLLKLQNIIKEGGMPGVSLPTANEYRSFLKYFVDPTAGLRQGERNTSNLIKYNENKL